MISTLGSRTTDFKVAYFVHASSDATERLTASTVLQFVTAQLIVQHKALLAELELKSRKTILRILKGSITTRLDQQEYFDVISILLKLKPDKTVAIVIEGLHRFQEEGRHLLLRRLIDLTAPANFSSRVKILLSSIPLDDPQRLLAQVRQYDPNKKISGMTTLYL